MHQRFAVDFSEVIKLCKLNSALHFLQSAVNAIKILIQTLLHRTQEQKRCLPITTISGRDHIHLLVAVAGLK